MSILTGRCKHCGKTLGRHKKAFLQKPGESTQTWQPYYCPNHPNSFYDSGLAALDAHKKELYEEVCEVVKQIKNLTGVSVAFPKLESILNQIEKEK